MSYESLLLHPNVRSRLSQLTQGGHHAVVLAGHSGAGKGETGRHIAAAILTYDNLDKLTNAAYFLHVVPEGKDITIEQIRQLQKFLTLKTTGTATIRRVVLVESADKMNVQAQNAILKTLEEPPTDTLLLLTATDLDQLLPTIRSRVQTIYLQPPSAMESKEYFKAQGYDEAAVARAYAISGGAVALMHSLLSDRDDSQLVEHINQAKVLLGQAIYERLVGVEQLSKDKEAVSGLIAALKRICVSTLEQVAMRSDTKSVAAWHARLSEVVAAEEAYARSANQKLLLTHLFIRL